MLRTIRAQSGNDRLEDLLRLPPRDIMIGNGL